MKRLLSLVLMLIALAGLAGCGLSAAEEKYNAGNDKYKNGDLNGALADYTEAIRLDPNLGLAYMNRSAVHAAQKNFDQAIEDATKAIELKLSDPRDTAVAYTNRAAAYVGKEEYDKALADTGEAIKAKADYAKAYLLQGVAYANQGAKDEAIAAFKKVTEIAPNSEEAKSAQQGIEQLEQAP